MLIKVGDDREELKSIRNFKEKKVYKKHFFIKINNRKV